MARSFAGGTDQISCGTGVPTVTTAMTMAGWVNVSSLVPAYQGVFGRGDAANYFYTVLPKSSGAIAYYIGTSPASTTFIDPGSHTLSTGSWVHLALSYHNVNGLKAYFNGISDGTAGTAPTANLPGGNLSGQPFLIGNDSFSGRNFNGKIADVGHWNIELTINEIAALATGARPYNIRPASIIGYWTVDGLQSPEPDLSGLANNGTLTGTSSASGPPVAMFTPRWPIFSAVAAAPTYTSRFLMVFQ